MSTASVVFATLFFVYALSHASRLAIILLLPRLIRLADSLAAASAEEDPDFAGRMLANRDRLLKSHSDLVGLRAGRSTYAAVALWAALAVYFY